MSPDRCRHILIHFRELWERTHWPLSSNWLQTVARRHDHTPRSALGSLTLDLFTLQRAIALLPQRDAAILMMRRWSQLTVVEISEALHCSDSTVRAVLARAEAQVADTCASP